jgi:predicted MFS family arabinose efflux permease
VRLQFMVLGLLLGTWGAHIPSVKAHYGIDEATLSMVLLAAAVGTVLSLFVAGRVVGRHGARRAAVAAGLAMCTLLGAVLLFPGVPALLPAALVLGAAMSLFDVAINTEGSALESLGGRPIMSQLHGMFSVGGMVGAGLAALLLDRGVSPGLQLPAVCLVLALVAVFTARGLLPVPAGGAGDDPQVHFAWPRGLLLVIGLLIFAGMTAEGVMYDWCVLYLKQDVGLSQAQAALGYAVFSGAMAAARFAGDTLRARYANRPCCAWAPAWPRWPWPWCCCRRMPASPWSASRWPAPGWHRWRPSCTPPPHACRASAARRRLPRSPRWATAASCSGRR